MKKIYPLFLAAISFFMGFTVNAQVTYQTYNDFGNDDYVNQVIPDGTGAHYYVGSSNSTGAGGYDALFTKTDLSGSVVWEKQFGGNRTEYGTRGKRTSDGNYVITGRTNSYSASGLHDAYIAKVDANGTLLWTKTYGGDSIDYAFDIIEAPDSGYIIAGVTYAPPAPKIAGRSSIFLVKTDKNGNPQWSKVVGSTTGNEQAYTLSYGGPQGFLVGGYSGAGLIGMNDGAMFFMDWGTGNIIISFVLGGPSDDDIRNIIPPSNGTNSLFIAGNTRSFGVSGQGDLFVAKVYVGGGSPILTWFKSYGTATDEYITDFQYVNDNAYLLLGHTGALGSGGASFTTMIDSNGVSQWTKYYDGPHDDNLMSIDVLPSSNFLLAGYSNSQNGSTNDFYLVQANADGTGCLAMNANISDTTRGATQATIPGGTFTADTFVINTATINMTTSTNTNAAHSVCISTGINNIMANSSINVYPNPASAAITISASSPIKEIKIIDNTGRTIYVNNDINNIMSTINTMGYAAGLYTVSVISDGESKNLRLTIAK